MKTILTTKAQLPQILKAIDKAIILFFGDWDIFKSELEFE